MMQQFTRLLAIGAMSTVAACGGSDDAPSSEPVKSGKILQRSITDDMLPYDTVRSQPPLADPEELKEGEEDATDGEAESTPDEE